MKKRPLIIRKTEPFETEELDVTPLLDVVFILLVFFIVTTSFARETGIGLASPSSVAASSQSSSKIHLHISAENKMTHKNRLILPAFIPSLVFEKRAQNPDSSFVVDVHPLAKTRFVVQAVDGIRQAQVMQPTVQLESP